ncbi:MAG: DUF3794 domain-containing protein [Firmicutes bacterium]|nr:DUF3794 domain-containing protein [Bacillota bacterium]
MAVEVIAEAQVQVLVEDTIDLFTPAQKIDEIRAVVQDLRCHVIPGKVIFQGILHKQIFFVNEDNVVVHQGVDIPFSGFVDIPEAEPGQFCQVAASVEFIDFQLLSPTVLRETTVILVNVQLLSNVSLPLVMTVNQNTTQRPAVFNGVKNAFVARGPGRSAKISKI